MDAVYWFECYIGNESEVPATEISHGWLETAIINYSMTLHPGLLIKILRLPLSIFPFCHEFLILFTRLFF